MLVIYIYIYIYKKYRALFMLQGHIQRSGYVLLRRGKHAAESLLETQFSPSLFGMLVPSPVLQHAPRRLFFLCSCERCCHCLQSCGNRHHLQDGVSLGHGTDFFVECRVSVFPRGPVRLVVVLTGHTAGEPVVMYLGVHDHEAPLVMFPVLQATGWRMVLTWVWLHLM